MGTPSPLRYARRKNPPLRRTDFRK